ncbi:MAG TPA: D-alanyl-D-alanine carboxypeptidase/D-alanyl-D-alanine-endopeptidase [Elusimicrobia bacterium]|nr:MAG: D-alanyl-D-alanine carboxypeptidase/D-alanyl-D-alanine-endopeptidase [Elusimicrobia bacterium GWD2_63_28]HCC46564.1 D-alanyl-D-alanine carboxypeptidase/D-alanyl-D-alanine-endopeptidase [Elusimicrobiota bacterium]
MKTAIFAAALALLPGGLEAADIKATIKGIAALPGIKNSSWGLSVKDASTGKVIAERNPRLNLVPASSLKVVVTAAALEKLGPEKIFYTRLYYDGSIVNGFLNGNLYIKGGGDLSLGSQLIKDSSQLEEVFLTWTEAVRAAGINVINGAVVGDDSAFQSWQPGSWAWEDIGNYYAAQPSALTVGDNLYKLYFKPAETVGAEAAVLRTEPYQDGLKFENRMKTGPRGSGDNGYVYAFPGQATAVLVGTIPQGQPEFAIKAALPDPALYAAKAFSAYLAKAGINSNKKPARGVPAPGATLTRVAETPSAPLKAAVRVTNKRSFNLYAELLLRHLGDGAPSKGLEALRSFLAAAGADVTELDLEDACGLSFRNTVKAETFTDMLRHVFKAKYFPEFYDSLVFPGDPDATGHLKGLGRGTVLEKNLRLKSGSLNGVRSYTGYLKTKKGRTLAFTSIMNNYSMNGGAADKIHEDLLLALYGGY